jgi:hypothetical protein
MASTRRGRAARLAEQATQTTRATVIMAPTSVAPAAASTGRVRHAERRCHHPRPQVGGRGARNPASPGAATSRGSGRPRHRAPRPPRRNRLTGPRPSGSDQYGSTSSLNEGRIAAVAFRTDGWCRAARRHDSRARRRITRTRATTPHDHALWAAAAFRPGADNHGCGRDPHRLLRQPSHGSERTKSRSAGERPAVWATSDLVVYVNINRVDQVRRLW